MHSIKSKARRAAWQSGSEPQYNPFARASRLRTSASGDLEATESVDLTHRTSGLHPLVHTESAPEPVVDTEKTAAGTENEDDRIHSSGPRITKFTTFANSETNFDDTGDQPQDDEADKQPHFAGWKSIWKRQSSDLSLSTQLHSLFLSSWITKVNTAAFMLVPAGFALYYCKVNPIATFFVNFFAIIPSAAIQSAAIEDIVLWSVVLMKGKQMGYIMSEIIYQTFNNAAQLISFILLLKTRQIGILQTSLLGSILVNLLLTPGLSFLVGGWHRIYQYYNSEIARTTGMLLFLAVASVVIPTAAHSLTKTSQEGIIEQSRGTAIIIMISYGLWLYFQLGTHREVFSSASSETQPAKKPKYAEKEPGETKRSMAVMGAFYSTTVPNAKVEVVEEEEEQEELPTCSFAMTIIILIISTALVGFNTDFAANSIQSLLTDAGLTQSFIGLVIVPFLGIDPLCITVAKADKMDLSLGVTFGRCMQTALMVIPFIVLLAWMMGIDEMTLQFDTFPVLVLFASIVIVTYIVQEGQANWLTGALLIKLYALIALSSYYVR